MSCELRAPGWLARHPGVGLALIVLGLLAFGIAAYQLQTNGPMIAYDDQLAKSLHDAAVKVSGPINETMTFGFFLGKEDLQILGAILVVYFLYKRFWPELGMVLIGWSGGFVIWSLLVYSFNRLRPEKQVGIEVRIPSFPSGHSMFATLAIGLLAYMLVPKMPSLFWKWVVAITAVLTILFVGYSRLFQGSHYLTDLIAGYGLGIAWGALVYTLLEGITMRRRARSGQEHES